METIEYLLQYILHIDQYLFAFVTVYGTWTYAVLFAIIFLETGLVITPFLPGDSLLFAAGSIAANVNQYALHFTYLLLLLIAASFIGNQVNYWIGRWLGKYLLGIINPNHLKKAHAFYEKHGGKTIILARFLPIIRTFAPFVAGMSKMKQLRFTLYNFISAILWISSLVCAGYFFGSIPFIKENFSLVIYGIIIVSLLPFLISLMASRRRSSDSNH